MSTTIIKGFPAGYTPVPGKCSIEDLKVYYLFGIDLSGPEGDPFPDELISHYLDAAIRQTEGTLDLCIDKRVIENETHDYHSIDYVNWGYIQLFKTPVVSVEKLRMTYGNIPAYEIPKDWFKIDKAHGQLNLFPSAGSAGALIINSSGAFIGMSGRFSYAPHSWEVSYTAGMEEIPSDILDYIYKLAAISVMTVWGDLIIGAGIASQSIGIDGLSQSISTTQSAMFGGASGRIESYRKDMELQLPVLRKKYQGILVTIL